MARGRVRIADVDIEEQRRIEASIEQIRKDNEMAHRIFHEQFNEPRATVRRGTGARRGGAARGARRGAANNRFDPVHAVSPARGRGGSRGASVARRARTTAPAARGRRQAARGNGNNALRFNGDRLQAVRGNDLVDVTDNAFFPDSEDDSDYDDLDSASSLDSDDDMDDSSSLSDSSSDPEDNGRRMPNNRAVSARFIESLLAPNLMRDNRRTDPLYREPEVSSSSDESELSEIEREDEEDEEEEMGDDEMMMLGLMRAAPNHINQPFQGDDRDMYARELDLFMGEEDDYEVPPPTIPMVNGVEVQPDTTWGDCTMCTNPPVKPVGCKKCLQFLGCQDCVKRWHAACVGNFERPTCPLCRAQWSLVNPGVLMMPTVEKHRHKAKMPAAAVGANGGPSTSNR